MNKKILLFAIIALAIDQLSKIFASLYLTLNISKVIIKNFFNLTLCHNSGVAWGMFSNQKIIIILLTIISMGIICYFMASFKKNRISNVAFGLLLGGLAGNLMDRIIYGYVIDFLDFIIFKYDFPVFNVADISIVIGVLLLAFEIIRGDKKDGNSSRKSK